MLDAMQAPMIAPSSRAWLLRRARLALASYFTRTPLPPPAVPLDCEPPRGCFVTIQMLPGALRGCVGAYEAASPLWCAVQDLALAAATQDRRFAPLTPDELVRCVLEIAVLTPPRPARLRDIEVGRHGLCVQHAPYRGVLLPHVPVAYGWSAETFLQRTCVKAGLHADAWEDEGVQVWSFTAETFVEADRLM